MSQRWLFILSCLALITSAFTFSIRQDMQPDMGNFFSFSETENGVYGSGAFQGMAASMLVGAFICDMLGMKRILLLALFSHIASTIGIIAMVSGTAPRFESVDANWWIMYGLFFLQGCGNGLTEVAINPLVASLYSNNKTHYLNVLHAWWPGGLIVGGLLVLYVGTGGIDLGVLSIEGLGNDWRHKLYLILAPAALYGLMLIPSRFPQTEAVRSGVPLNQMLLQVARPLFLIWAFCMVLTAATELGPQQWQQSVMTSVTGGNVSGTLILVYTSSLMFVMRHFAGPIAHRISPIGLMLISSVLAGSGLYLLSYANNAVTAFGYATLFGLGIAYFWPTMLGVGAERFPKGGALLLAVLGCVGNLSISQVLPRMGSIVDHYSVQDLEKEGGEAATFVKVEDEDGVVKKSVNNKKLEGVENDIMTQLVELERARPELAARVIANKRLAAQLSALVKQEQPNLGTVKEKVLAQGALDLAAIGELATQDKNVEELKRLLAERAPVRAAKALGFSMAFRWVSVLPVILVVIFGGIFLYDLSRGGYKPEILTSQRDHEERLSGGVEGPIE